MPSKRKGESEKEYKIRCKKYRERHKGHKNKLQRAWYYKNREKYLRMLKEYRDRNRKQLMAILGDKCRICGCKPKRLILHEVHGKKHSSNSYDMLKHINDFIPLCVPCHIGVHFAVRYLNLTWKQITDQIRDPNKPEIQPEAKRKISRGTHTFRLKRGDNSK